MQRFQRFTSIPPFLIFLVARACFYITSKSQRSANVHERLGQPFKKIFRVKHFSLFPLPPPTHLKTMLQSRTQFPKTRPRPLQRAHVIRTHR